MPVSRSRAIVEAPRAEWYRFDAADQVWNNWLLFTEDEGDEDSNDTLRVRPRYKRLICPACHGFDHDRAFKAGFDGEVRLRARGDIIETSDGFYCVSKDFVAVGRLAGFRGIVLKPVGRDGWHVLHVTRRVDSDPRAYRQSKRTCPRCGRSADGSGLVEYVSEIQRPPAGSTFFTTKSRRIGARYSDRDLFATGEVVAALKKAGVKGGTFRRLLDAEEETRARKAEREDSTARIARAFIVL